MIITILDIVHPPVFYLKHDVSEAGFCLLQVEPAQMGPLDKAGTETLVLSIWPT
jgi:hypothetical protein